VPRFLSLVPRRLVLHHRVVQPVVVHRRVDHREGRPAGPAPPGRSSTASLPATQSSTSPRTNRSHGSATVPHRAVAL
jgi:hypothetical protein